MQRRLPSSPSYLLRRRHRPRIGSGTRSAAVAWRGWLEHGIGFLVLWLVHLLGMNLLANLERGSLEESAVAQGNGTAEVSVQKRFVTYRLLVRLTTSVGDDWHGHLALCGQLSSSLTIQARDLIPPHLQSYSQMMLVSCCMPATQFAAMAKLFGPHVASVATISSHARKIASCWQSGMCAALVRERPQGVIRCPDLRLTLMTAAMMLALAALTLNSLAQPPARGGGGGGGGRGGLAVDPEEVLADPAALRRRPGGGSLLSWRPMQRSRTT